MDNTALPIYKCAVCNQQCNCEDSFKVHLKTNHTLTLEKYFKSYFKKVDLLDNIEITYKSAGQYFYADFNRKDNMYRWLKLQDKFFAKKYLINKISEYIAYKGYERFPSWAEFHFFSNFCCPNRILEFFDNFEEVALLCKARVRFKYKGGYPNKDFIPNKIIIDTREKKPFQFCLLEENKDGRKQISCVPVTNKKGKLLNTSSEKLSFGDYHCIDNPKIFVERKSAADLISTLSSGYDRFLMEVERCKNANCYLIVVVEKDPAYMKAFNLMRGSKYLKASPEFIAHRIREVCKNYPQTIQFLFSENKRIATWECLRILGTLAADKYDWQFYHDNFVKKKASPARANNN